MIINNSYFILNLKNNLKREEDKKILLEKQLLSKIEDIELVSQHLHNDKLFIGTYKDTNYSSLITARTNIESIEYLKKMISNIEIIPIEIKKSNNNIK